MKKNPSIGKCPCPVAGCAERCDVKKFAPRHTRDSGRRLAGKLYLDCPAHGRIGNDGRATWQEWILENATLTSSDELASPPPPPPVSAPAPAPAARAANPPPSTSSPAPSKKTGWGYF